MAIVFALIAVTPLHISTLVIRSLRILLTVGGVFGFGARRLMKKRDGA